MPSQDKTLKYFINRNGQIQSCNIHDDASCFIASKITVNLSWIFNMKCYTNISILMPLEDKDRKISLMIKPA